jgi:TonB-dependent starch-binding outer membrane protein SusC
MGSKFIRFLTLFMVFAVQLAFAQEKKISGVVSDEFGPIPGANVLVKSSQKTTVTDFDGKFTISAKKGDVIEVSSLGKRAKSITVQDASVYNVRLEDDSKSLTEVVINVGYRSTTQERTTASQATVTSKTLENRPNVNFLSTLQGQVAGANISAFSGQPGTNKVDVIIRGSSSILASADPLYVIDGVPLTQAFFRNLNPSEIESVTVLKDAAATAIYGNRGTNGVILITTKKGSFKKSFAVNYSSSYGTTEFRGDDYNLPNAVGHLKLQKKGFDEGVTSLANSLGVSGSFLGGAVTADPANLDAFATNTNWQDIFLRTGTSMSHDLNFTTGSENMSNFTAFGYFDQEGIVPTTNFKRFTVRSNFNGKNLDGKFNYNLNIFGAYSRRNQLEQETRGGINNNVLQNPLTGYLNSPRFVPSSLYENGQQLFTQFGNPALNLTPLMLMDLFRDKSAPSFFNELKTIVTAGASYKVTKDITASTNMGMDYSDDKRNFAIGPEAYLSVVRASGAAQPFHGLETISSSSEFTYTLTNKVGYNKKFADKHTLDFSVFQEYLKAHRRTNLLQQIGLNPLTWSPGAGTGYIPFNPASMPTSYRPTVAASKADAGLLSYFSSADYDYDSRYGVSATFRRDGSYRFADENKWGNFWSIAGRWNITNESFLKNNEWISEMKLRASYGTTGNQNVVGRGVDSNTSTIFIGNQLVRDLNSSQSGYNNSASFGVSSIANTDLVWEETQQWNLGLDFGIKRRLNGSLDVYNKRTIDLYDAIPVSAGNGATSLSANNGTIENRGVELVLRYDVFKNSDFKLGVFANGAYNENNIRDLGKLDPDGDGLFRPSDGFIRQVGRAFGQYFLVPYAGVNPGNGNLLFVDINGNLTETPTDVDRRRTNKQAAPQYQGGFGLNSSYKGFFVDVLCTYALKAYKFDTDYIGLMDIRNADNFPVSNDLLNAWTPTNNLSNVPALAATNLSTQSISDRFLRDASYLRIRNLTVGYTVPSKFLEKSYFNSVKFRVMAENYWTFTKWKGFDPEAYVTGATGYYPTPKILTFGLDVNF